MNGTTPTTAAPPTFDPCTLLDGIEARLAHLADLITGQDIPTDPDTSHQADHHTDTEDPPHE